MITHTTTMYTPKSLKITPQKSLKKVIQKVIQNWHPKLTSKITQNRWSQGLTKMTHLGRISPKKSFKSGGLKPQKKRVKKGPPGPANQLKNHPQNRAIRDHPKNRPLPLDNFQKVRAKKGSFWKKKKGNPGFAKTPKNGRARVRIQGKVKIKSDYAKNTKNAKKQQKSKITFFKNDKKRQKSQKNTKKRCQKVSKKELKKWAKKSQKRGPKWPPKKVQNNVKKGGTNHQNNTKKGPQKRAHFMSSFCEPL